MSNYECDLNDLLSVREVVRQYPHIYPTENSLRWEIYSHRQELMAQGVLVKRGRRVLINRRKLRDRLLA